MRCLSWNEANPLPSLCRWPRTAAARSLICMSWHVPDWSVSEAASCRMDFGNFPDRRIGSGGRSRHSWQSGPRHDEILGCLCADPIVSTGTANRLIKKARSRGRGDCGLVGFAGRMFIGACTTQKRGCAQYCRRRASANGITGAHDCLDGGGTEWVGTRTSRAHAAPPPIAGSRCASVGRSYGMVPERSHSPCLYLSRPTVTGGSSTRGVSYLSTVGPVSII
jgi:hypothetical protein